MMIKLLNLFIFWMITSYPKSSQSSPPRWSADENGGQPTRSRWTCCRSGISPESAHAYVSVHKQVWVFKDFPLKQLALLLLCHLFLLEVERRVCLFDLDWPVQAILLLEYAGEITVAAIKFTPLHIAYCNYYLIQMTLSIRALLLSQIWRDRATKMTSPTCSTARERK